MTKKFIIVSNPRCGFHYLKSLINQHSKVHCYGELWYFRRKGLEEYNIPKYKIESSITDYMDSIFECQDQVGKECTGFKIAVNELNNRPTSRKNMIEYINQNNIPVIYLKRENLFQRWCSESLAIENNAFFGGEYKNKIFMDLDVYIKNCKYYEKCTNDFFNQLGQVEKIELTYEELKQNPIESTNNVFDLLQVEKETLDMKKTTKEQLTGSVFQYLTNGDKLIDEAKKRIEHPNTANRTKEYLQDVINS